MEEGRFGLAVGCCVTASLRASTYALEGPRHGMALETDFGEGVLQVSFGSLLDNPEADPQSG